jgi:putative hemolysin
MEILIIIGLILLNGLLSMSEIALVSTRKSKLETEAKRGSKKAQEVLALSNDPNRFLSTVQIGITLIGILTGFFSGETIVKSFAALLAQIDFLAPYAATVAKITVIMLVTYLTLVLGELVPKRIGMNKSESISKTMARPMGLLSSLASPIVWLLSKSTSFVVRIFGIGDDEGKVTEEEIKAIVKEGVDDGEVQEVEHDIVERVFNLGDRDVDSIMTHRSDIVMLNINDTRDEIKEKVIGNMHNVYPVLSDDPDDIHGVVYLKDLFGRIDAQDFSLEKLINPAQFLPENQSVYLALEQFKKAKVKYGLIINEFGDIQGMITLGDIMEALVGQVHEDEYHEITARDDNSFLVDGQCSFYNFLEYMDMEYLYAEFDYNTLSGLILSILEHIPKTGEKLEWQNFEMEIVDMDGARIDKVLVRRILTQ